MSDSATRLMRMDAVSLAGVLVAALLYLWPVHPTVSAATAPPVSVVVPSIASPVMDTVDAATVVTTNILSASRRAPSKRYRSPDQMDNTDYPPVPAIFAATPDSAATANAGADEDAVPALYGIVQSDGSWRALLRLSTSDVNPTLLREGDRRGGYRVVSIRANAVVLAGSSGQRTLFLARPSRGDSTRHPL